VLDVNKCSFFLVDLSVGQLNNDLVSKDHLNYLIIISLNDNDNNVDEEKNASTNKNDKNRKRLHCSFEWTWDAVLSGHEM